MVPELDALHERGLFTRPELQEVVRRRTEHEYAIKRPGGVSVADFIRYVEYESKLEKLRKIRAKSPKALELAKKDKLRKKTKGKAEFCIVRRMHFIFSRAINKFSGEVRLWKAYFDFCKHHGGSKMFSRTLAKALQLHPNKPGMWIEAASWELNGHRNENAARALLQQGLRICKKSKVLWYEYFKFELLIARRMQLRREVIKLSSPDKASYSSTIASGAIASVVMKKVLQALGDEPDVYIHMLDTVDEFDRNTFPALEEEIVPQMKEALKGDTRIWNHLAKREMSQLGETAASVSERIEHGCSVYAEGLAKAETTDMYESYIEFLCQEVTDNQDDPSVTKKLLKKLLNLAQEAEAKGLANVSIYVLCIDILLACKSTKFASQLISKALQEYPSNVSLCQYNLVRLGTREEAVEFAKAAVSGMSLEEFDEFSTLLVEWSSSPGEIEWMKTELQSRMNQSDREAQLQVLFSIACRATESIVAQCSDIAVVREFYKSFLALQSITLQFYETCVGIEVANLSQSSETKGKKVHCQPVVKLLEAALFVYGGTSHRLWQMMVEVTEMMDGDVGSVYWRASKALGCELLVN
jgi:U3 small nucleolar RNA-associated protein 6